MTPLTLEQIAAALEEGWAGVTVDYDRLVCAYKHKPRIRESRGMWDGGDDSEEYAVIPVCVDYAGDWRDSWTPRPVEHKGCMRPGCTGAPMAIEDDGWSIQCELCGVRTDGNALTEGYAWADWDRREE